MLVLKLPKLNQHRNKSGLQYLWWGGGGGRFLDFCTGLYFVKNTPPPPPFFFLVSAKIWNEETNLCYTSECSWGEFPARPGRNTAGGAGRPFQWHNPQAVPSRPWGRLCLECWAEQLDLPTPSSPCTHLCLINGGLFFSPLSLSLSVSISPYDFSPLHKSALFYAEKPQECYL